MEEIQQKPNKYNNARIYSIRNYIDDDIYIGSTTQSLVKRFSEHKRELNKTKMKKYKLYYKFLELGIDNFYIELVQEVNCENREQLLKIEGECIRKMATLNKLMMTDGNRKEYSKQRYENNRESFLEKSRTYRLDNPDKNREWCEKNRERYLELRKNYRIRHRETLLEKAKLYNELHKEERKIKAKKYYDENKDKILQQQKMKREEKKHSSNNDDN